MDFAHARALPADPTWFKRAVFYEVLVRAFYDSDADGVGDLRGLRVSAHFLIRRDGEVLQFVSVADRAWHAGVSAFQGRPNCNDFSIGVELEGCDTAPFAGIQMTRLAELAVDLATDIPGLRWMVGHSDIAPGRKTDPGPFFDWQDLARRIHHSGARLERPPVV